MIPASRMMQASGHRGGASALPRRTVRLRAPTAMATLVLSAAACGTPPSEAAAGQDPGATIRDSAGIEIVENHAPVWESGEFWTVDPEPEFVLGGLGESGDSAHLIWQVRGAKPLSDGRIALLTPGGDRKVLVYEPTTGRLSAAFGRSGRGPGEFVRPVGMQVLPGDTIVVWDVMFGPVYYFDPSGRIVGERRIDLGALVEATRMDNQQPGEIPWPLPDGSFGMSVHQVEWARPDRSGVVYRAPIGFVRIDSAYSVHRFGGWWGDLETLSSVGGDNLYSGVPFATSAGLTFGGEPLSAYVTNNDSYEVHQFSATGVLQRILRRSVDPLPVTNEEYEEWRTSAEEGNPLRDWRKWDQAAGELPPRHHPIIKGMRVDSEGFLWIRDHLPHRDDTTDFSVFSPEGLWLGTVQFSAPGTFWIGEDFILARRVNHDTGVESVERYRLDRRGKR